MFDILNVFTKMELEHFPRRYIVFDSATPEDTLHNAITSHPLIKFVLCDEHDVMVELLGYHRQG